MKKIHVIALLGIPLGLILGFVTKTIGVSGGQETQAQEGTYHHETDYISMAEVGKLLERLGKEIQENNSINLGGKSFSIVGHGGLELSVRPRGDRTSMQIEINAGATGIPTQGKTYVSYARSGNRVTPTELAERVTKVGKTLASTGTFVMEDHTVALEGTASIVQRITEEIRRGRGRGVPYTFSFDVVFGEQDFLSHKTKRTQLRLRNVAILKSLPKRKSKVPINRRLPNCLTH